MYFKLNNIVTLSQMETLLMNNIAIVTISVKMGKMLSLHVRIICDIPSKKMNVIGQSMWIVKEKRITCGKVSKKISVNV